MLNKNLDLNIEHYVSVDFSVLVHVIDALGGIDINVEKGEIIAIIGPSGSGKSTFFKMHKQT